MYRAGALATSSSDAGASYVAASTTRRSRKMRWKKTILSTHKASTGKSSSIALFCSCGSQTNFLWSGGKRSIQTQQQPFFLPRNQQYASSLYLYLYPSYERQSRFLLMNSNHILRATSSNSSSTKQQQSSKSSTTEQQQQQQQREEFLTKVKSSLIHDIVPQIYTSSSSLPLENHQSNPLIIVIGVSGGCDSIALFHSLVQILKIPKDHESNHHIIHKDDNEDNDDDNHNDNDDDDDVSTPTLSYINVRDNMNNDNTKEYALACNLHVVHFDHKQRGDDSDGDRLFVKGLCQTYNIPFHCYYWNDNSNNNNKNNGQSHKSFSQESARDWRRNTSLELMKDIMMKQEQNKKRTEEEGVDLDSSREDSRQCAVLLTAHHKDDSEETMLMKLLRGVHITNLSGMDVFQSVNLRSSEEEDAATTTAWNNSMYIAKPLLNVRKNDIQLFLNNQNLPWREDASNASNKYTRNRVRNEIIPLLQDFVGGEDILERRLENLQDQSQKVKQDLDKRAEKYSTEEDEKKQTDATLFHLPKGNRNDLNLVEEHALHLWLENNTRTKFPYEKLMAISRQLADYPRKRQWSLTIGSGWEVIRNGDVLQMNHVDKNWKQEHSSSSSSDSSTSLHLQEQNTPNQWVFLKTINNADELMSNGDEGTNKSPMRFSLQVCLKQHYYTNEDSPQFTIKSVKGNERMRFLPPWRKGKNPVKIKEFLRGQRIPLHRREMAPILCVSSYGSDSLDIDRIVAVYVENVQQSNIVDEDDLAQYDDKNRGKWIIHADFDATVNSSSNDTAFVREIMIGEL